ANGFGQSPIQVPGPVLVVLPVLLSSVAVGWCLLWRQRGSTASYCATHDWAVMTLAFVGTWATAGFVYYLNRSYASGQLQILLMPVGVCLVALVSLGRDSRATSARASSRDVRALRSGLSLFPLAVVTCLAFASMTQSPNPAPVIN